MEILFITLFYTGLIVLAGLSIYLYIKDEKKKKNKEENNLIFLKIESIDKKIFEIKMLITMTKNINNTELLNRQLSLLDYLMKYKLSYQIVSVNKYFQSVNNKNNINKLITLVDNYIKSTDSVINEVYDLDGAKKYARLIKTYLNHQLHELIKYKTYSIFKRESPVVEEFNLGKHEVLSIYIYKDQEEIDYEYERFLAENEL